MCMLLCTVICSPRLKCSVLCVDSIVLAFCIFIRYCCDFCAAFRRNKEYISHNDVVFTSGILSARCLMHATNALYFAGA